jgi:hypothetical protein
MPTLETQPRHSRVRGFSYRLLILSDYNAQHYTAVDRIRIGRQRSAILFIHMSWRKNLQKLSHAQVREIASLCAGAVLLIAVALVLSGSTTFLPQSLRLTLQRESSSQTAAAWWSLYSNYDSGWPLSHNMPSGQFSGAAYGWCNTGYYTCPLPSYADVYVTGNPTQAMLARVALPGYHSGWQPYQGPTYSGSDFQNQYALAWPISQLRLIVTL